MYLLLMCKLKLLYKILYTLCITHIKWHTLEGSRVIAATPIFLVVEWTPDPKYLHHQPLAYI
jgi:hypothetical protein